jgi:uncharacterized protein (TIGR03067 family)
MIRSGLTVAILVVGAVSAQGQDDGKKELEKLKGTWTVTEMIRDGKENANAKDDTATFDGTKLTIKTKTGGHLATVKLDAGKKPMVMDMTPDDGAMKGKVHLGIFEISGDTLKMCFSLPDKPRPASFESKEGSGTMSITLKREKK